ncbi:MAG: hypothetical protein R2800_15425 [Flavipsychrobacter sp.]
MIKIKKPLLVAVIASLITSNTTQAQEFVLDSIAANTTPLLIPGSGMSQMTYALYKKTGHKDKITLAMLDPMLAPMMTQELDTKGLGDVLAFAGNDQASLFLFYDNSKKKATLATFGPDGNIITEKAYKGITIGDDVTLYRALSPEGFVLVSQTSKKAGFKVEGIDSKLDIKWTYNGKQKMVAVDQSMDILNITAVSQSAQGNETYSIISIQTETGDAAAENVLKHEEQLLYPTFTSNKEGMGFTGGLFFKDGNPNNKTPDGIFIAQVSPDGEMAEFATVPYSLIIEDIKDEQVSEQLASGKYKLMPVATTRKMDGSGSILVCELFSRKKTADGNTRFEVMDMVSINFNIEQKYESLSVIKKEKKSATVKGELAKANHDWSVATWLLQKGFFDFKLLQDFGGRQALGYTTVNNGEQSLCFNNLSAAKSDCVPYGTRILSGSNTQTTYTSGQNALANSGILSTSMEAVVVFENNGKQVLLYTLPLIAGEPNITEPMHHGEEPHHEEEPPVEEN